MPLPLLTRADYAKTVIAVPPIALTEDGRVSAPENRKIMRHIADGGIPVLLYGGNANLYHFGLDLYREAVDVLHAELTAPVSILFSAGPGFGTALDHVKVLRQAGVRSIMLLPTAFPSDQAGVGAGVRRIADTLGNGIVLYIKRENYVAPDQLARLVDDGEVTFVKYAVERTDPADDGYLDRLLAAVGTDVIASGMAETPIADHVGRRRMAAYTSGGICIAPRAARALLEELRAGRIDRALELSAPFLEFERLRARLGGIQTLHDALAVAGIARTGPILPLLSNLGPEALDALKIPVAGLQQAETQLAEAA